MQTGGTRSWPESSWHKREFTNKALKKTIAELDEVSSYLVHTMDYEEDEKEKCCELLTYLNWIRRFVKSFSAPVNIPELLKQD